MKKKKKKNKKTKKEKKPNHGLDEDVVKIWTCFKFSSIAFRRRSRNDTRLEGS